MGFFQLISVKNHVNSDEGKWEKVIDNHWVWHENAAVYTPLHSCCARTKSYGCSCLTELGRGRSEIVLLCSFHSRESWTVIISTLCVIFCFPKHSWWTQVLHKFTKKQNIFCYFYKTIEQGKKLNFFVLPCKMVHSRLSSKKLWALSIQKTFLFNSCWCFLLFLISGSVRNTWLEYLDLMIAEMQ